MDKIKVSIIIPVYNVEKYLRKCLDSVINQTLKEIEIICVNDGSTDNSPKILEEYSLKDKRIKIINKKNNGTGAARNTGMEYVKGEYIGFLDSDDWVKLDAYEKLYLNAKTQNSDIVMCPVHVFDDFTKELRYDQDYFTLDCLDKQFEIGTFTHRDIKNSMFSICVTPWNKLYKNKFLKKIKARFPENVIFEDNPFFFDTYLNTRRISLIRDFLIYYRINRIGSIVSRKNKTFLDIIKIFGIIKTIFINANNYEEYKPILLAYIINNFFYRYNQVAEEHKQEFFELIKHAFVDMDLKNKENSLNSYSKNIYLNVMKSYSAREFEVRQDSINELKKQKQFFDEKLKVQQYKIEELTSLSNYYQEKVICLQNKENVYISKIKSLEEDRMYIDKQLLVIANTKPYRIAYFLRRTSHEFFNGKIDEKKDFLRWIYLKFTEKGSSGDFKHNPIKELLKK